MYFYGEKLMTAVHDANEFVEKNLEKQLVMPYCGRGVATDSRVYTIPSICSRLTVEIVIQNTARCECNTVTPHNQFYDMINDLAAVIVAENIETDKYDVDPVTNKVIQAHFHIDNEREQERDVIVNYEPFSIKVIFKREYSKC
jgi:hypothetical protein